MCETWFRFFMCVFVCLCAFLAWRHNTCVCLYLMFSLLQGSVCAASGQQLVGGQSRAEMSRLAPGTHLHLGTSSCWRQPSLAPIHPWVLQRLSPSGDVQNCRCARTNVYLCGKSVKMLLVWFCAPMKLCNYVIVSAFIECVMRFVCVLHHVTSSLSLEAKAI